MKLVNRTSGEVLATRVVLCDTFWRKFRGLMFRRPLAADEAYIFAGRRESIAGASIHMFFVFFAIAVIWLDARWQVVDKVLARPFHPLYAPRQAAQYFVEGHPSLLEQVQLGDELELA